MGKASDESQLSGPDSREEMQEGCVREGAPRSQTVTSVGKLLPWM